MLDQEPAQTIVYTDLARGLGVTRLSQTLISVATLPYGGSYVKNVRTATVRLIPGPAGVSWRPRHPSSPGPNRREPNALASDNRHKPA